MFESTERGILFSRRIAIVSLFYAEHVDRWARSKDSKLTLNV